MRAFTFALLKICLVGSLCCGAAGGVVSCGGSSPDQPAPVQIVATDLALTSVVKVGASSDGSIWLIWTESAGANDVVTAARVDAMGRVTRSTLATVAGGHASEPQIVIAGTTPVVSWTEQRGGTRGLVAAWVGQRWVIEQTLGSFATVIGTPQLTAGGASEAHVTWVEYLSAGGTRLLDARRSAGGTWSAPTVVRTTPMLLQPARLALDADGVALAVWTETISAPTVATTYALLAAPFDPALGQWADPVTLDTVGTAPRIESCGTRDWVVAWRRADSPADRGSVMARRLAGGFWRTPVRVDTATDEDPVEIALASSNGSLQIAWTAAASDILRGRNVRAAKFDCAGGQWSAPSLVTGFSPALPSGLDLEVSTLGRAALVWGTQTGAGDPALARSDGTRWQAPFALEDGTLHGNAPSVAALGGGWVAAWYRFGNGGKLDVVIRRVQ